MPFDWTQVMGAVVVIFGAAVFYLQFRHGLRATKGVKTAADLQSLFGPEFIHAGAVNNTAQ